MHLLKGAGRYKHIQNIRIYKQAKGQAIYQQDTECNYKPGKRTWAISRNSKHETRACYSMSDTHCCVQYVQCLFGMCLNAVQVIMSMSVAFIN